MIAVEDSRSSSDATPDFASEERFSSSQGFSLTETLMALLVVTMGFMAVAQMMFVSLAGLTLSRTKGTAVMVAQDQLEVLTNEYREDPDGANLTTGNHPANPLLVAVTNPVDNKTLDRYNVTWTISTVSDARGYTLKSKQVLITVTPILTTGTTTNINRRLNKVFNMTTVLSPRWF